MAATRERKSGTPPSPSSSSPPETGAAAPASATKKKAETATGSVPFLLDFFPQEGPEQTRLAEFFRRLRAGGLSTTRCRSCEKLHWPPRVACPQCHSEDVEWVDLPTGGTIYAFSAMLVGAPTGMEQDLPFAVGLVDLDGIPLRIFGRIDGKPWNELAIGDRVRVESFEVPDGRVFYRFHTD